MANEAVPIMKSFMEALNSQDYEKAASFLTDDCVYEDVPSGTVFHGAKEVIDFARVVRFQFPDRKWEIKSAFSRVLKKSRGKQI
jgi:limonene-1,2-epoxide hydrolase